MGPTVADNKICGACGDDFDENGLNCTAAEGTVVSMCVSGYGLVATACEECEKENCENCDGNAAVCAECSEGYGLSADGECSACAGGCADCFT